MTNNIIITQGLVIPDGAKVLIAMGGVEWTEEEYDTAKKELKTRFPNCEFTFVSGATGFAIMNADFEKLIDVPVKREAPHSRSCGLICNGHDPESPVVCKKDCPTCHGVKPMGGA